MELSQSGHISVRVLSRSGTEIAQIPLKLDQTVNQAAKCIRENLGLASGVSIVAYNGYLRANNDKTVQEFLKTHNQNETPTLVSMRLSEDPIPVEQLREAAQNTHQGDRVHIKSIEPDKGSTAGGQVVKIKGQHFPRTPLSCSFGSVIVPTVYVSNTELTCTTPSHAAGPATVELAWRGVKLTNDDKVFTFIDQQQCASMGIGVPSGPTALGYDCQATCTITTDVLPTATLDRF
mmetsp:Transcript_22602/g.25166  ORF Transcript_22602/g.25166 Transcript_22602/m.25166 type:complete len:234 (-) Transcript_22602:80-781(-)